MMRILAITQCFQCGSWLCIEKILGKLSDSGYEITIVGLGEVQQKNKKFKYTLFPYPAFNKYGDITCRGPLYNLLWNLPLIVIGLLSSLITRPRAVIYNGLATGLTMSPFVKLMGLKNIIMYHSFLGVISNRLRSLLSLLCKSVDLVVVNSTGSAKDVSAIVKPDKVIVNEHFAEDIFFESDDQDIRAGNAIDPNVFVVSYVGRIDEDKLCFPLMAAAKKLGPESGFIFNFAGAGSDIAKVEALAATQSNVHYVGYIKSREELRDYYRKADVMWSLGNETYLCLPTIEALASGTPTIVPIYGEVRDSMGNRKYVDKNLVPSSVGWFVDTNDPNKVVDLLVSIKREGIYKEMSKACTKYAEQKYSKNNLITTINKILPLISYAPR